MKKYLLPAGLMLVLCTAGAVPGNNPASPITAADALGVGPLPLGPLPAVTAPATNPQDNAKIYLGKQLYFDPRLSADGTVSCATCHDPKHGWSDAGPTSKGIAGQMGGRRAPPVSNAAYHPLQFWDGRAASLEEQAIGPIANPIEMGFTHDACVACLEGIPAYVDAFRDVFGTPYITIEQVGQAIAAYERTVVTTDSPFDRYARGDNAALTPLEREGLEIFNGKGHCTSCHWGPNFSDGRFHNLGVPQTGPLATDDGRYEVTKNPKDKGAFKTPTARDAGARPPYLHTGGEKTIEAVIRFYNKGGGANPNLDPLMVPLGLSEREIEALVAFMEHGLASLNAEVANEPGIPADQLPR